MQRLIFLLFIFGVVTGCSSGLLFAQGEIVADTVKTKDVKKERHLKNTIRFNLTNPLLFGEKSIIFGYERTLGLRQSFSLNAGITTLPKLLNPESDNPEFELKEESNEKGLNTSIDYRFYLNKVNKFSAPRGVYIGPYFSYNYFERENTWTLNTANFQGDVISNFRMDIETLGFELGYQFVFWERLALDFVLFGPGVAGYSFRTSFNTTLSPEEEAELFEIINDYLSEKFPGYNVVIDDKELKKSGTSKTTDFGFRYMVHLGFRF